MHETKSETIDTKILTKMFMSDILELFISHFHKMQIRYFFKMLNKFLKNSALAIANF